jgi:glyoxylase-like metal-dependent hydrolase (beta-lactamase superfamily II)
MVSSLKRLLGEVPSNTRILPGHGPETTMATEVPWMVRIARSGFLAISD